MRPLTLRAALLAATALLGATPALAQSAAQIDNIQAQIRALNAELAHVRRDMAAKDAAVRAAQADAAKARATAEQTQAAVADLPMPAGFKAGTGRPTPFDYGVGVGPANPDYSSPKTDWTSINIGGVNSSAGAQNAGVTGPNGTFHVGGLTLQLGGFIAAEGLFRSRNETTSIGTNFNAIPFPQAAANHENEFRLTAQQSRFSLLAHGDVGPAEHVEAYTELDFLGAAPTANTNESNSYNMRLRLYYATYDNDYLGFHALAGQSWSLATLHKTGVTPHQEDVPYTIDAQYVPGFTWARQPQFRIAKDFGSKYWLAASFESPQTVYSVSPLNGTGNRGTVNFNNPGVAQLDPNASYSIDVAPDVILKAAADPGYGHYELYGIAKFATDRVAFLGDGHNNTRGGGGVGGGAILPLIGDKLSFQASALAGYGISRYGSGQLPDSTIGPNGAPDLLPEVQALVGFTGHPKPEFDLYAYGGTEQLGRRSFNLNGKAYGYGNPAYSNAGCDIELSTAVCTGNTSGITQGTIGAWWRFLQGNFGTVQSGIQYSYTVKTIFNGVTAPGGSGNASVDNNIVMFSLRYLPFQ